MARINACTEIWPHKYDADGVKICSYCSGPLKSKGLKYCCEHCRDMAAIEANPHTFRDKVYKYLDSRCFLCDKSLLIREDRGNVWWNISSEIHHIVHVQFGGDNKIDNLCNLCHDCHVRVHKLCRMVEKILNEKQGSLSL
jgi:hypothetical protein